MAQSLTKKLKTIMKDRSTGGTWECILLRLLVAGVLLLIYMMLS